LITRYAASSGEATIDAYLLAITSSLSVGNISICGLLRGLAGLIGLGLAFFVVFVVIFNTFPY
jgi:hypothetical protein